MADEGQTGGPSARRAWPAWVAVTAVLSVVAGLLVFSVTRDEPGAVGTAGPLPPDRKLIVSLGRPGGGDAPTTKGIPVTLDVEVVAAAPVRAVELWAGTTRVGGIAVEPQERTTAQRVSWTPTATGATVLTARAVDTEGRQAQSNPLRVDVAAAQRPLLWAEVTSTGGQTLEAIAADKGATAEAVAAVNPDLPATGEVPPGSVVKVPIIDAAGLPLPDEAGGSTGDATGDAGAGTGTDTGDAWSVLRGQALRADLDLGALSMPPPSATATVDGCTAKVELRGADGLERFRVSALAPGGADVATLADVTPAGSGGGTAGSWSGALGGGRHLLIVAGVRDGGEVLSTPVEVDVPASCSGEWSGSVRLVHGLLTGGDTASANLAFAFLSTDGTTWVRVPELQGSAVPPATGGGFDLSPHLPRLEGSRLQVQAWGYRGTQLASLGEGTFTPAAGARLSDEIGTPQQVSLDWIQRGAPGQPGELRRNGRLPDPGLEAFQWSTSMPGATHAVWQVSWVRPTEGVDLRPAGLLAQGTAPVATEPFTIDLRSVRDQRRSIARDLLQVGYVDVTPGGGSGQGGTGGATSTSSAAPTTTAPTTTTTNAPTTTAAPGGPGAMPKGINALPPVTDVWIRVVPMAGDQPLGRASNAVHLDLRPEGATTPLPGATGTYQASVRLVPPKAPELLYATCWKFEGWDQDLVDQKAFAAGQAHKDDSFQGMMQAFTEGGVYGPAYLNLFRILDRYGPDIPLCAGCYEGAGGLGQVDCSKDDDAWYEVLAEAFVSGLTYLWDEVVVGTFNAIKDFAVDAIVTLTGCEEIMNTVKSGYGDYCDEVASAALDAVLAAYGIPPSLPTTGDLIRAAKGELSALLVSLAELYGVPCDDIAEIGAVSEDLGQEAVTCESLADDLIDKLPDFLDEINRQQAASVSGIQFPPGARIIPHPRGTLQPAQVDVLLVPDAADPPSGYGECPAEVSVESQWETGPVNPATGRSPVFLPGFPPFTRFGMLKSMEIGPQRFTGSALLPGSRTVQPNPSGSSLSTVFLSEPAPLPPTPAVLYSLPFGFIKDLSANVEPVPTAEFLLHDGAEHAVTVTSPCFATVGATVDTGEPGPQR